MRKKFLTILLTICVCFCFVGCGKEEVVYGYQDILTQVKDGTYKSDIADIHKGWIPEKTDIEKAPDTIKAMTEKIANFKCKDYVGYKVQDKKIYYGFAGVDTLKMENVLVCVIQDTDNNMSVEIGDFKDIDSFYHVSTDLLVQVTSTATEEGTESTEKNKKNNTEASTTE